jgi:multiple sugar transport system ATP-binding protein
MQNNGSYCVELNGTQLPLSQSQGKQAETHVGKEVMLGIRPEDILSTEDAQGKDLVPLKATVEVLEPLGAEIILELSAQGQTFTSRMGPQIRARMHDEIDIYFDMERCHLFDTQTEQSIV